MVKAAQDSHKKNYKTFLWCLPSLNAKNKSRNMIQTVNCTQETCSCGIVNL